MQSALGGGSTSSLRRMPVLGNAPVRAPSLPPTPAVSSSCSPARKAPGSRTGGSHPASPAKRHAQRDLTQKLRAMDLALERIERDNGDLASESDLHSTTLSVKENLDPLGVQAGSHAPRDLTSGDGGGPHSSRGESSASTRRRQLGFVEETPPPDPSRHSQSPGAGTGPDEDSPSLPGGAPAAAVGGGCSRAMAERLGALEVAWRDSHALLSAECEQLAQDVAALRGSEEERARRSTQSLTDFEVELTTALEARAKETDGLLERRLVEAGEGLMRRLIDFESTMREENARISGVEGDLLKRLDQMEAAVTSDRLRTAEASKSQQEASGLMEAASGQLTEVREQIQDLQRESGQTHEQLCELLQQLQRLQLDKDEVRGQLASMSRQMQQQQQHCQDRGEASTHYQLTAETERRFQLLDDTFNSRLRETESSVLSQHHVLKAQVHELKCNIEVVQHKLQAEISDLRHGAVAQQQTTRSRHRPPLANGVRTSNVGRLPGRGGSDRPETVFPEEELEARLQESLEAAIADLRSQAEQARIEDQQCLAQRFEQLAASCADEAREVALSEVDRQLGMGDGEAASDEQEGGWAARLDTLANHQQRQQALIEELVATAARRAGVAEGGSAGSTDVADRLALRIDALATRVCCLEERSSQSPAVVSTADDSGCSAGRASCDSGARLCGSVPRGHHVQTGPSAELLQTCVGRLDKLSTRLALVEERTAAACKPVSELQEAAALLRAELRAVEDAGMVQAAHLEALAVRTGDNESGRRELEEKLAAHEESSNHAQRAAETAEKAAADAAAEAQGLRQLAEQCELVCGVGVGAGGTCSYYSPAGAVLTAGGHGVANASSSVVDREAMGTLVRLEARLELMEAKQRISTQELRGRVDELHRIFTDPNAHVGGAEVPWVVRMRDMERELKALLAAQVEDSANALRSMAKLVEEQSSHSFTASTIHSQSASVHSRIL